MILRLHVAGGPAQGAFGPRDEGRNFLRWAGGMSVCFHSPSKGCGVWITCCPELASRFAGRLRLSQTAQRVVRIPPARCRTFSRSAAGIRVRLTPRAGPAWFAPVLSPDSAPARLPSRAPIHPAPRPAKLPTSLSRSAIRSVRLLRQRAGRQPVPGESCLAPGTRSLLGRLSSWLEATAGEVGRQGLGARVCFAVAMPGSAPAPRRTSRAHRARSPRASAPSRSRRGLRIFRRALFR